MTRTCVHFTVFVLLAAVQLDSFGSLANAGDSKPKARLTVDRIYGGSEFKAKSVSAKWMDDGESYTTLEKSSEYPIALDIVEHNAASGDKKILVSAGDLIPSRDEPPIKIEDYAWSKNLANVLIYANSKRVWRQNTRGDYWVFDRSGRELRKLGGKDAASSSLMFAKFSPDGQRVAYVRASNIYVEDLRDGTVRRVTKATLPDIINGTFDWVYEEELGLRDGFRWSPDGKHIAFWQLDTSGVREIALVDNVAGLYPRVQRIKYPKVGQQNSASRIGVVNVLTGKTLWMDVPGDPRNHYLARMQWVKNSNELLIQQLNRLQNRNKVILANTETGQTKTLFSERDEAWVDVHDEVKWFDEGKRFTWISERDGWRHAYLVDRKTGQLKLATKGDFDVIKLLHLDEERRQLYFLASPDNPTQRYLYRSNIDGSDLKRITPADRSGSHRYQISPNGKWAIHEYSTFDTPPTTELVSLPDHQRVRVLAKNKKLKKAVGKLARSAVEFFRVPIGDSVEIDGWCMKPPKFKHKNKYPVLIHVYGEPAGQTVTDRWQGSHYLWHLMMSQRGYVVMSFDNRGTNSPRSRGFRKSVYRKIGILPPQDQAAALEYVLNDRKYLAPKRVAIWGWSGGGSSSLQAIFKYPRLYSAAIAIAPVPNQRLYDTIYQERYMGLPDDNARGYLEGSAINFAKQLQGQLLLVHGTGDDNCHYQGSEALANELIRHNKQFELMAYPNRSHSIRELANTTLHLRTMMTNFLLRTVPPESLSD